MFYICKKRSDGKFGVMDTTDGVVEYYDPTDLLGIVNKFHVSIEGVVKIGNGKFKIKVLKPTSFKEVDSDNICTKLPVIEQESNKESVDDNDSEYYKNKYEDLSDYEITKLAEDLAFNLARVISTLTTSHYYGENLELLDGLDCVGYDNVHIIDDYSMQIYCNPDVKKGKIFSKGFGFDLYKDGKMMEDSHFDALFKDWEKDFKNYKYKWVFSLYNM